VVGAFSNIFKIPELKRRVLFSFLMLAVYRVGCAITVPGVNGALLKEMFRSQQGTIFGMISLFSGGALENGSIFSLGIMPYVSASIILQLLTVVIPYLDRLSKEGEVGRRKITQYTRYGTVILSVFQGYMIAYGLENGMLGNGLVTNPGLSFRLMTMVTLAAGTSFIMWLGEQISERGIGNGISLIIFAGIIARMPSAIAKLFLDVWQQERRVLEIVPILVVMIVVVGLIIFVERAQRKIPIQHAKRVVGRKIYGGASTFLPLRINSAGVIPQIFASSILMFPSTIAKFFTNPIMVGIAEQLAPGRMAYNLIYVAMIIFFTYFYTAVTFNPVDVADNLKKSGAYIPGRRPGKPTADYIDRILTRITFGGACYLAAICVLPTILITQFDVPFYFGGTSLLIVVGVALDTIQQVESHMLTRHYDGFLGAKGKFKGRR